MRPVLAVEEQASLEIRIKQSKSARGGRSAPLRAFLIRLERILLNPRGLPDPAVFILALLPSLVAGLILFRLPALEILAVAFAVGVAVHVLARILGLPLAWSPLLPAVVGVSFLGAGAGLAWVPVIALVAAVLEVARARLLPAAALQTGLLAFAAAFLVAPFVPSAGPVAAYVAPLTLRPAPDPIALWSRFFEAGSASPVDPIRLYVGNVPGPVFATSLLAVALGIVWLWYAHRLRPWTLLGFLVAGFATTLVFAWNPLFQLDSGPLWFVGGLVVANAAFTRHSRPAQALVGIVFALAAVATRSRGAGIEAAVLAGAAVQIVVLVGEGVGWLLVNRARVGAGSRGGLGAVSRVGRGREERASRPRVEGG